MHELLQSELTRLLSVAVDRLCVMHARASPDTVYPIYYVRNILCLASDKSYRLQAIIDDIFVGHAQYISYSLFLPQSLSRRF